MGHKIKMLLLAFILISVQLLGQDNNRNLLQVKLPSTFLIKGTSTLHDWESTVEKTNATLLINNFEDLTIETLEVKIKAESIKSGKKLMDKLTYKALKSDKFPEIIFVFKKGDVVSKNDKQIDIKLNGDLSIAGVTKNITVLVSMDKQGNTLTLKGNHKLKMTDYGIKPPKALLGTIKTGDEITVDFNLKFNN